MIVKNQIVNLTINSISSDGNGVGRFQGFAIFVPFTAIGDNCDVRIVKVNNSYAFGIIERLVKPSSSRIEVDCPFYKKCGGCNFRHISYEDELTIKENIVSEAVRRIGGIDVNINPIVGAPSDKYYRNKVQFPIVSNGNELLPAFYQARSHRLVSIIDACKLQPILLNKIAVSACKILSRLNETAFDEEHSTGNIRHVLLKKSSLNDDVLLCVITFNGRVNNEKAFVSELVNEYPNVKTIVINKNKQRANTIISDEYRIIYGPGYIEDEICGVPAKITYDSFFQINHESTEQLYNFIKEIANVKKGENVIDLYCGTGTIGLSCSTPETNLVGIEVVSRAIESAKEAAERIGYKNAKFIKGDASVISELLDTGFEPDVVITDPPRKGCSKEVLEAITESRVNQIIMVSCNPSTLARDLRYLVDKGYIVKSVTPFDLFPRTKHVETVCCLYHQ